MAHPRQGWGREGVIGPFVSKSWQQMYQHSQLEELMLLLQVDTEAPLVSWFMTTPLWFLLLLLLDKQQHFKQLCLVSTQQLKYRRHSGKN